MLANIPRFAVASVLALCGLGSQASTVHADFTSIGGVRWVASIDIVNDGSLPSIESFTVYFDHLSASNLKVVNSPLDWDSIVAQPDLSLPAAGFFDALLTDPVRVVRPGETRLGFLLEFDWLNPNGPASLNFTINDPSTFLPLESGFTVVSAALLIPEPSSLLLAALAACGLLATRRQISAKS